MSMLDRLLTKGEAAEILGVGIRTVERMVVEGELPSVKIRRCRRILESAVWALIEALGRPPGLSPTEAAPFVRVTCPGCGRNATLPTSAVAPNRLFQCAVCGCQHRL